MNQYTATITLFFLSLIVCLSIACNTSSEKTTNETTNAQKATVTPSTTNATATQETVETPSNTNNTTTQEATKTPKPVDNSAVSVDAPTTTTNTENATSAPAVATPTKTTESSATTTTKAATEKTEAPKAAAGTVEGDAQRLAELLCKSQKLVEDALTAGDGMDAKLNEANQVKGQYEELKKTCQKNHSNWGNFLKALKGAVDVCGGQLEGF